MRLKLLHHIFSVCKLSPGLEIPVWALRSELFFIAKTSDELSIMCPSSRVPTDVNASHEWRCFRVDGDLEFDQVGVVATVSGVIAKADISLFLVSTHDRDYVLVHQNNLDQAVAVYRQQGFFVEGPGVAGSNVD